MLDFEFENTVRLIFGSGKINELGELCREIGKKPLLVTTHSLDDKSGFGVVLDRAIGILEKSGIKPVIYDKIVHNPTTTCVDEASKLGIENKVDYIIGLGGGSAVDAAKAIAISVKTKRPVWDFLSCKEHDAEDIVEALPVVAVDTTAGTGTAVTSFFVITNPDTNEKPANGALSTLPKISIVDPELMLGIPPNVTAETGLDAFYHAFEAYISKEATPITDLFAVRALELIKEHLPKVYSDGSDIKAREGMALASVFAGYAISIAAAVLLHAISHSISGFTNVSHGLALSSILEPWVKYTYPRYPERVAEVIKIYGTDISKMGEKEAADTAASVLNKFRTGIGVDITLKKTGISESNLEKLAVDTFATMKGCVDNQPGNPVNNDEVLGILKKAYEM
jgi:alcohol dehydrogenase